MLQYSQLKVPLGNTDIEGALAQALKIKKTDILTCSIAKKSVDARKELRKVYHVIFSLKKGVRFKKNGKVTRFQPPKNWEAYFREIGGKGVTDDDTTIVVGSGPAGLFCAYVLSLAGRKVCLIERGAPMKERKKDVEEFFATGVLKEESNICFGEGGAGTFSDGKLNSMVKDKTGKKEFVLKTFHKFGAPDPILTDAKPHMGTDYLETVISHMRKELEKQGVEVIFHGKVTDLLMEEDQVVGVQYQAGEETLQKKGKVVLAIGHSARDTFHMLAERKLILEPKGFAVGVRVAHKQEQVDRDRYHKTREEWEKETGELLSPADYKLTARTSDGRGVYSFCMCPGGYVVASSTEPGRLCINGMSDQKRDGKYANSAIVVTVKDEDFKQMGKSGIFAGMEFQRELEELAYLQGKGRIPAQFYPDFKRGVPSEKLPDFLEKEGCKGKIFPSNLKNILPEPVWNGIIEGMEHFSHQMPSFCQEDTVLFGTETRTSSPLRIVRDSSLQAKGFTGLYPCGEGAGYAGGIMSAALDGIKVAMAILGENEEEPDQIDKRK